MSVQRIKVVQDALGTAVGQSGSCQGLTLVVGKSPLKILARLTLRGGATCRSYRAVMTHIFNAAKEMNVKCRIAGHKPIVSDGWWVHACTPNQLLRFRRVILEPFCQQLGNEAEASAIHFRPVMK